MSAHPAVPPTPSSQYATAHTTAGATPRGANVALVAAGYPDVAAEVFYGRSLGMLAKCLQSARIAAVEARTGRLFAVLNPELAAEGAALVERMRGDAP